MRFGQKVLIILGSTILVIALGSSVWLGCTPSGKRVWNNYRHSIQKADDDTNYKTLKEVEDTCRSMIASYNADKLTYEQYKNSEDSLEKSWANSAKMRANQTASSYNNYILKNSYVWRGNVPIDIYMTLSYLE